MPEFANIFPLYLNNEKTNYFLIQPNNFVFSTCFRFPYGGEIFLQLVFLKIYFS